MFDDTAYTDKHINGQLHDGANQLQNVSQTGEHGFDSAPRQMRWNAVAVLRAAEMAQGRETGATECQRQQQQQQKSRTAKECEIYRLKHVLYVSGTAHYQQHYLRPQQTRIKTIERLPILHRGLIIIRSAHQKKTACIFRLKYDYSVRPSDINTQRNDVV